jgi:hypothetical protein
VKYVTFCMWRLVQRQPRLMWEVRRALRLNALYESAHLILGLSCPAIWRRLLLLLPRCYLKEKVQASVEVVRLILSIAIPCDGWHRSSVNFVGRESEYHDGLGLLDKAQQEPEDDTLKQAFYNSPLGAYVQFVIMIEVFVACQSSMRVRNLESSGHTNAWFCNFGTHRSLLLVLILQESVYGLLDYIWTASMTHRRTRRYGWTSQRPSSPCMELVQATYLVDATFLLLIRRFPCTAELGLQHDCVHMSNPIVPSPFAYWTKVDLKLRSPFLLLSQCLGRFRSRDGPTTLLVVLPLMLNALSC